MWGCKLTWSVHPHYLGYVGCSLTHGIEILRSLFDFLEWMCSLEFLRKYHCFTCHRCLRKPGGWSSGESSQMGFAWEFKACTGRVPKQVGVTFSTAMFQSILFRNYWWAWHGSLDLLSLTLSSQVGLASEIRALSTEKQRELASSLLRLTLSSQVGLASEIRALTSAKRSQESWLLLYLDWLCQVAFQAKSSGPMEIISRVSGTLTQCLWR